jgi:hypothetical protein
MFRTLSIVNKNATDKYKHLVKQFADKECELLTTFDEYNELSKFKQFSHIIVKFIASCKHENTVTITNFISKSSGIICKKCMALKLREIGKVYQNENKENRVACKGHLQENEVYNKIYDLLKDHFIIQKTNEGCNADFILKPKDITIDEWLMIQIKSTNKECHNLYSFTIHNKNLIDKYKDNIILCHCIDNNLNWLIPYENISHLKCKINIGKKSIYNKYLCDNKNINDQLLEYYNITNKYNLNICMLPCSIYQKREYNYRLKRETACNFIKFNYPEIDGTHYDFMIKKTCLWTRP